MKTGISLHVGLNYVDKNHYSGWDGALNGCLHDAKDMQMIADQQKFKTHLLINEEASRDLIISNIKAAADQLVEGDIFFVSFSGHGGKIFDSSGDEIDRQDETWCLYDGQLIDDELKLLWIRFKAGVRILVITDCCHSGTNTKDALQDNINYTDHVPRRMPNEVAERTYLQNQNFYHEIFRSHSAGFIEDNDIQATVRLISGCQDNQYSYDDLYNGRFTMQLKRVWGRGAFGGNYQQFYQQILSQMPAYQSPNHYVIGQPNLGFDKEVPFTV